MDDTTIARIAKLKTLLDEAESHKLGEAFTEWRKYLEGDFDLTGCVFPDLSLDNAQFGEFTLTNAKFVGSHLNCANFAKATLNGASFENVKAQGVHFSDAKLNNASFIGGNFKGAGFHRAEQRLKTFRRERSAQD